MDYNNDQTSTTKEPERHFLYLHGQVYAFEEFGKIIIFENVDFKPSKNINNNNINNNKTENIVDLSNDDEEEESEHSSSDELHLDDPSLEEGEEMKRVNKRAKMEKKKKKDKKEKRKKEKKEKKSKRKQEKKTKKELKKICDTFKKGKLSGKQQQPDENERTSTATSTNTNTSATATTTRPPIPTSTQLRLKGSRLAEASEKFYKIKAGDINHHLFSPLFEFELILVTKDKKIFNITHIRSFRKRLSNDCCSVTNIKKVIMKKSNYYGPNSPDIFKGKLVKNFGRNKKITEDTVIKPNHLIDKDDSLKKVFQNFFIPDAQLSCFFVLLTFFSFEFNDFEKFFHQSKQFLTHGIDDKEHGLPILIMKENPSLDDMETLRSMCKILKPRRTFFKNVILADEFRSIFEAFYIINDYKHKFDKFKQQIYGEDANFDECINETWSDGTWKELKMMDSITCFEMPHGRLLTETPMKAIKFKFIDEKKKKIEQLLYGIDFLLLQAECDLNQRFFDSILWEYSAGLQVITNSENRKRLYELNGINDIKTISEFSLDKDVYYVLIDRCHFLKYDEVIDFLSKAKEAFEIGKSKYPCFTTMIIFCGSTLLETAENSLKIIENHPIVLSRSDHIVITDQWKFPDGMIVTSNENELKNYFENKNVTVYFADNPSKDKNFGLFKTIFGKNIEGFTHFRVAANPNRTVSQNNIFVLERMKVNQMRLILNHCSPYGKMAIFSKMSKEDFMEWYSSTKKV